MYWRLNRIQYPVYNLGRGKRIGIWTQGCSIGCENCISKSLWSVDGGRDISLNIIYDQILKAADDYDGLTITGGEPMDQYKPLMEFCKFIKSNTNMDILVYSGYTIKQIMGKYPDGLFMKYIDLLIDGPYYETSHSDSGDRGSSNQRLYEFKSGCPLEVKKPLSTGHWSVSVSDNSEVYMSGIPKKNEMKKIKKILEHKGIGISFK